MSRISYKAKALFPGGLIGVVATGSPVAPQRRALGIAEIQKRGYEVREPLSCSKYYGNYTFGFSNGSVTERVSALMELIEDEAVSVIIAARGGYGTAELLESIDFRKIRQAEKLIVGCSDVSVLLNQCVSCAEMPAIHGTTLASCFADASTDEASQASVDALFSLLSDSSFRFSSSCEVLVPGKGQGRVIGGNLSALVSLLGTPWDVDYRGAILVIEEVGEAPYRVHRLLLQLKHAGKLNDLAGIVFGRFSRCRAPHGPTVDEVIENAVDDMLGSHGCPILRGLAFGHWGENQPLPLGCVAEIRNEEFFFTESPIG